MKPNRSKQAKPKVLITNARSSFEKIKSPAEAKLIYSRLPGEAQDFYCKGESALFSFRPLTYDSDNGLEGYIVRFDGETEVLKENVIINFSVGSDRYYTVSDFIPDGLKGLLKMNETLFRLERRTHYRVTLPQTLERSCNLINHDGRSIFISAVVLDISQGGARLQILEGKIKDFGDGAQVRCALHIKSKWQLELLAQVRHVNNSGKTAVFGLQWLDVSESDNRKLLSMMLELQREVLRG